MVSKTIERGALPWWAAINISMKINEVLDSEYITVRRSPVHGRGVFATQMIPAGTVLFMDPVTMISDHDWNLIKDTRLVKMYGLKWVGNTHAIPLGPVRYAPSEQEQRIFSKTKLFKNGVGLSPFLMVNHDPVPNCEEVFDIPRGLVGIKSLRSIDPDEELFKRYKNTMSKEPVKLVF